jgi:hypothetical protein
VYAVDSNDEKNDIRIKGFVALVTTICLSMLFFNFIYQ